MDFGLLIVRVVVGALFVGHGTQKLFGWFGGHGLQGTAGWFRSLGYRDAGTLAVIAGVTEATAGLLLVLGLMTPLAAAGIMGVMINAIFAVHRPKGLWVSKGGYEYPLVLVALAAAVAFSGAGAVSLDAAIGWTMRGPVWGVFAILLGLMTGAGALSAREVPPEEREERHAA